jgi:serine/threonine-protein kinase
MSDVLTRLTSALDTRYRISREVGVGGMATVFLAHDLRHERDVAIKVLHPDLAAALGSERFLAEIKTTAKLQHPHILPLLDSGEADGLLYYVMPYVAGESLRARLERETQLAVDDAIRISREVASALDYAHRHGVVHRDIKPENILIHEDQALVADFGIALAVSAAGGARMTQTGLSLGTPQYMAPEQAMGERAIDGRADIYALGAVTYEMLVGEPPFTGPTVQAIVARVMTESPRPVTGQRRSVQGNVNAAVLRALEKLPADRFHTAAEFSAALTDKGYEAAAVAPAIGKQEAGTSRLSTWIPWSIAAVAAIAAIAFAMRGRSSRNEMPIRASADLPAEATLVVGGTESIGISADGQTIAIGATMGGQSQLLLRRLDEDQFHRVQGSQGLVASAAFSQDGKWIAFHSNSQVFRAPVAGGTPTALATTHWGQIAWTHDNHVVYTKDYDTGLFSVSMDGRDSAALTTPDRKKGELGHWWPQALPDGDHILFTNYTTPADRSQIEALSLKSGKRTVVLNGGYFGRYSDGHLLFIRNGTLLTVPMNASSLKVTGVEVPVPIDVESNQSNGWAAFAIADNGTMVYLTDASRRQDLSWSNENGDEEPAVDSAGGYSLANPSPDGKKIAVVKDGDVWIIDRARKLQTRLTRTAQPEIDLVWTPDSRSVIYARDNPQYDIYWQAADGSESERLLVTSPNDKSPNSVSPDGKTLLYHESVEEGTELFVTQLSDPSKKQRVQHSAGNADNGVYSPNGKWIAYLSTISGRQEVYVTPSPGTAGAGRQQVTDGGGEGAEWAKDGTAIYYSFGGQIRRVKFNPVTGEIGSTQILNRIRPVQGWYVGPDGRFLTRRIAADAERHSVKILFNWTHALDAHN